MVAGLCTALELNSNPPFLFTFLWQSDVLFGKLVNGGEDRLVFVSFFCKEKSFQNLLKGKGILNDGFNSLINSVLLVFATDYLKEM